MRFVSVRDDGVGIPGGDVGLHCIGFEQFDRLGQHDGLTDMGTMTWQLTENRSTLRAR